jgi:group I intron endonuclease
MSCGIYKITNLINGKNYIGQSKRIEYRWKDHIKHSKYENGEGYNYPLYQAFRKYGLENFEFTILEECSISELDDKEQFYIDKYNSILQGYNQARVGQGGTKLTPRQVLEIIEELKSNTTENTEEIGKKFNVSGRTIRAINIGESWFDETLSYPIRPQFISSNSSTGNAKNYCKKCGKEVYKGSIYCTQCFHLESRTCERPSREELKQMIRTTSFTTIGKQYGVTDNTIRKWCVAEKLPKTKKEINSYSNEEWDLI